MNRNRSPWPWLLLAWFILLASACAWWMTALDSCMQFGYSGVECLINGMGK